MGNNAFADVTIAGDVKIYYRPDAKHPNAPYETYRNGKFLARIGTKERDRFISAAGKHRHQR